MQSAWESACPETLSVNKNDPVPEEEELESVDETEFGKLRLCDLYSRVDEQACSAHVWSQLTLASTCVPRSLTQRVIFARGPPTS